MMAILFSRVSNICRVKMNDNGPNGIEQVRAKFNRVECSQSWLESTYSLVLISINKPQISDFLL